jgi:hypothetical protein
MAAPSFRDENPFESPAVAELATTEPPKRRRGLLRSWWPYIAALVFCVIMYRIRPESGVAAAMISVLVLLGIEIDRFYRA